MRELTSDELESVHGQFGLIGAIGGAATALAIGIAHDHNAHQLFVGAAFGAIGGFMGGAAGVLWTTSRVAGTVAFVDSIAFSIGADFVPEAPSIARAGGSEKE